MADDCGCAAARAVTRPQIAVVQKAPEHIAIAIAIHTILVVVCFGHVEQRRIWRVIGPGVGAAHSKQRVGNMRDLHARICLWEAHH